MPARPVIAVKGLHKTYRDGTHAVRNVSFNVQKGEIFGLLGPNGAGKTTTMRILGTLHEPSKGSASVLGMNVVQRGAAVRQRIGFAMQEVGMDDLATADEMLRFHASLYGMDKKEAKRRTRDLLQRFGLAEHAKRRVTRFSGGMQRRLDLAVSLIHEPEVLFLDEPSTGLDPTSRSELWDILLRLRRDQGITILLSTHYMEEADVLCDRIGIMNEGRLVAINTPDKLKQAVGADTIRIRTKRKPTQAQESAFRKKFRDMDVEDDVIEIRVRNGGSRLLDIMKLAQSSKLPVASTRVLEPTLDDVFLKNTGQRLEEAQVDEEASE